MPLQYDASGNLLLPKNLVNALIVCLANVSDFDSELARLSEQHPHITAPTIGANFIISDLYREELRACFARLDREKAEMYERLAREFPQIRLVRNLPVPMGREGDGQGMALSPVQSVFESRTAGTVYLEDGFAFASPIWQYHKLPEYSWQICSGTVGAHDASW
ncbi:hypothetical protein K504DRAFT_498709 [Pleomassaria siparia CBS 279.74]|uniref:Uncharacterized protein n=1 Tax=Pleomassaria siparia CBS 279.74 TaxID=1314801 RepID=A0A6G1KN56_9PLEO|nr:hypothetical protein K504DRAFT_498709 [Pleomassaria siparia CBS 279.74]